MTSSTTFLLLGPLALFAALYALGGTRRWAAIAAAVGLALEALACLRLPTDSGLVILEHALVLDAASRMALAWAAGASALLALAAAFVPVQAPVAMLLLPAVSASGAALALGPGLPSLAAMGVVMPLAAWLFQARTESAGRGASRVFVVGAMGLCAFAVADVLLTRALTAEVEQVPPWATIGGLAIIGTAAYLGLFPFSASLQGIADAGRPLAAGWVLGVFQPLVLVHVARAVGAYPELLQTAPVPPIAVAVAAVGALTGGAFAAASDRPSRMLAYSALPGMAVLYLGLFAAEARASGLYWLAVAGYSLAVVLASVALVAAERDGSPQGLAGWAGAARRAVAALALLLVAALGLCALPVGVGFWVHARSAPPSVPVWVERGLAAAPLVASAGWWRVLWAAVREIREPRSGASRLASLCLWALAGAATVLFVWPAPLLRIATALAAALGSL